MSDSSLHQVFIAGHARKLFEQSGEVKLGKAGKIGEGIDGAVFRTVVVDVVTYIHEFLNIVMLFVGGNVGEFLTGIKVCPADCDKETNHQ